MKEKYDELGYLKSFKNILYRKFYLLSKQFNVKTETFYITSKCRSIVYNLFQLKTSTKVIFYSMKKPNKPDSKKRKSNYVNVYPTNLHFT